MPRLTCKQKADAWEIAATKATQAGDPAFLKVALARVLYPVETAGEEAYWMERAQEVIQRRIDAEIEARVRMHAGKPPH